MQNLLFVAHRNSISNKSSKIYQKAKKESKLQKVLKSSDARNLKKLTNVEFKLLFFCKLNSEL